MESIELKLTMLSKEFDFKLLPHIPVPILISKGDNVLVSYLIMVPSKPYSKYGSILKSRLSNIKRFLSSTDYRRLSNSMGGRVTSKSKLLKAISKIEDRNLRNRLNRLFSYSDTLYDKVIVVTALRGKKGLNYLHSIFYHELVHLLLIHNDVLPKRSTRSMSQLKNEALTIFLEYYLKDYDGRGIDFLKEYMPRRRADSSFDRLLPYVMRFDDICSKARSPKGRKEALLKYLYSNQP